MSNIHEQFGMDVIPDELANNLRSIPGDDSLNNSLVNAKVTNVVAMLYAGQFISCGDAGEGTVRGEIRAQVLSTHGGNTTDKTPLYIVMASGQVADGIRLVDINGNDVFAVNKDGAITAQSKATINGEINLGAGTSFPASPPTNGRFYRTDLGLSCYYDGTRWLTVNEYSAMVPRNATAYATTTTVAWAENRKDYAPYITRVALGSYVNTTNDGTNYWTITISGQNDAGTVQTTIYTRNTSADSADAWKHVDTATLSTNTPANYTRLDFNVTTTNAPGSIYILITVFYRLIVT